MSSNDTPRETTPLLDSQESDESEESVGDGATIMGAKNGDPEAPGKKSAYKRYIPGYGTYRLVKRAPWYSLYVLSLLLGTYLLNQLNRYTLPITTQAVAQDLHYGDQACMLNAPNLTGCVSDNLRDQLTDSCSKHKNRTLCNDFNADFNTHRDKYTNSCDQVPTIDPCYYDYDGGGLEYQILAGPVFNNVYPFAGLILGPMADFVSRKVLLALCLFFLSVFSGLMGFAKYYWHLVLLRMMVAIFAAGCTPYAASLITDYFQPELRGSALGIYNWGIYLGYSLAFLIGNQIEKALNWEWVFYISGMMGIALTPFLLFTIKEHPNKVKTNRPEISIVNEEQGDNAGAKKRQEAEAEEEKKKKKLCSLPDKAKVKMYFFLIMKTFCSYSMPLLLLAGGVRNAGGYVWAYNTEIFFHNYRHFSKDQITYFMSWIPLVCGSIGAFVGGLVSDLILKVSGKGPYVRVVVLFVSQLLAAPFALGALWIPYYPWCFLMLIPSNIIGEMWIGVTLAIVIDISPKMIKTTSVAIYLFVITIIGGNFNLIVQPIQDAIKSEYAIPISLTVTFPGLYFLSSFLFLGTFFVLRYDLKRRAAIDRATADLQLGDEVSK